jgi:hypothetical protein
MLQYEYLQSEYEETEYLFEQYKSEFYKECPRVSVKKEGDTAEEAQPQSNNSEKEDEKEEKEDNETEAQPEPDTPASKILTKLYRKLSLKTHPDKLKGNTEHFQTVSKAFKEKDILKLLMLCKTYDVDVDFDNECAGALIENAEIFDAAINSITNKISEMKKTLAWNWAFADDTLKQRYRELYHF